MGTKTDEIRQHIFNMLQNAKADGFDTKDIRAGDEKSCNYDKRINIGGHHEEKIVTIGFGYVFGIYYGFVSLWK